MKGGTGPSTSRPRPIAATASTIRPLRPSMSSASATSSLFGVACGARCRSSAATGRSAPGADAIALVQLDGPIPDTVLAQIRKLPLVKQAKSLAL